MYKSLAHFRRLAGRLNIVRQVANFSFDLDDQKTQDDLKEHPVQTQYKPPSHLGLLINPSSAPLTNEEITKILENVKLHHVRFIFNRILAHNCFDNLLLLVPYFIERQLVNNKTVLPIVQALSRAWIQKGSTEQIASVAEQLRPFLPTNNLGSDAKILLDICSGIWPIALNNANDILLFKDDCFDALVIASLRNSDSRKLKEVIKLFPNRYMHSSPDVFEVFLRFVKTNKFLLGIYLNQLHGKVITHHIFDRIKKVVWSAKGSRYVKSKVVDGKCEVCNEKLTERTLTTNEFEELTMGFTDYFQEQCKLSKGGTMTEFNAIDHHISRIKQRPNCKTFAVIDGLNLNGGRMRELPGFMDTIRLVKKSYDVVFLIMRVQILSDRMKLLQQDGIDFFRLGKHSLDDLFAIYAALKFGQDANIVTNDRFADTARNLTIYPGLAELFTIWAKNQTVGHAVPARLFEPNRYSNLLDYSPKTKSAHFMVFYDDHNSTKRSSMKLYGFRILGHLKLPQHVRAIYCRRFVGSVYPFPDPPESDLEPRAPVVTIMGHVDHGKTTLLDSLRNSRLVSQEFGGITQHIGAFSVKLPNSDARVTFLDTPGHAAFKEMRARGARSTDIVVLVVAADDGVKDQTVESIKYATDAKVPMVVAINKCDKPSADPEKAKRSLLEYGIVGEDLGGDTQIVEISALYGRNIDALQEALILQAELMELRSTSKGPVEGVVIESTTVQGLGKVCTLIVKRGTLKKGTVLVAGSSWGKVRSMVDEFGKPVTKAGPSTPVRISGWRNKLPNPGEISYEIVDGESKAQKIAAEMSEREMLRELDKTKDEIIAKREADRQIYLQNREILHSKGIRFGSVNRNLIHKEHKLTKELTEDEKPTVRLILRTDVDGTLEAIQNVLDTYDFDEVDLQIIDAAVGPPVEEIVEIAAEFKAYIVCFNTPISLKVKELAAQKNVEIEQYNIIYKLVDALKLRLDRTYGPITELELAGEGHVLKEFMIPDRERKRLPIAGTLVDWGVFTKDATYRFSRNGEVIYEGRIESLKRTEEFVSEANVNTEVGIAVGDKKIRFKPDDMVEAFKEVTRNRQVVWSPPGF